MIAIAVVAVFATVSVEARFGEPVAAASGFEMPVKAGIFALAHAKRTALPSGEVMLFVAGGTGAQLDRELAHGPVRHVKVRELPRGLAVILTPVDGISPEDVVLAAGKITVAAMGREPMAEGRKPSADDREAMAESRLPRADSRQASADERPPITDTKPSSAKATTSSTNPFRNFIVLTLLIAGAAAVIVLGKRRKLVKLGALHDGIEVVSVKALGTKQRLAVVEVSGERMLIAASDTGLQLLSKLDGTAPRATQTQPPTQAESLSDFAAALADVSIEQPTTLVHPKPKARRSTDVAGLIKLRATSAWTLSEGGDGQ